MPSVHLLVSTAPRLVTLFSPSPLDHHPAQGFSNLLGDGISMGFGEYLSAHSENSYIRHERDREKWEFENFPEVGSAGSASVLLCFECAIPLTGPVPLNPHPTKGRD